MLELPQNRVLDTVLGMAQRLLTQHQTPKPWLAFTMHLMCAQPPAQSAGGNILAYLAEKETEALEAPVTWGGRVGSPAWETQEP